MATAKHLDNAARSAPIAVGGVSIGAAVAAAWALAHPGHAVAVLAALPAWTGEPDTAPAADCARIRRRCCGATPGVGHGGDVSPARRGWPTS